MNDKYSDYQIYALEKALKVDTWDTVAKKLNVSITLISFVKNKKRILPPAACILLAKNYNGIDIKKLSTVYSKPIIDWIIGKYNY
jgi:hypothetical protein